MEPSSLEAKFARFAATRDARALADVFDATAAELARVARHLTRDEAEAEDVVQGTFLEAMEHAARFDATRPLLPWLVGILEHQAHDARRRSQRCIDATRVARDRPRDAAHEASSREFFAQLTRAVRELPETYRVVLASHIDGHTSPEIGKELGLEDGTVRVRIHRGLALLRKLLPPGFLAGALFVELTPRGLAAVRDALTASTGAASAGTFAAAGGWIVVNKLLVSVAAAVLVGTAWFLLRDDGGLANLPARSAQTASPHERRASANPNDIVTTEIPAPARGAERTPTTEPEPATAPWSRGIVRNAIDLTPIANATVHGQLSNRTDPDGDFDTVSRADGSFDVPPSFSNEKHLRGFIVASAAGFARGRDSTSNIDPLQPVADIRLQPIVVLEGRVSRDDGAAIAGATIEVFDDLGPLIGRLTTTTDANGDYRVKGFEPELYNGIALRAKDAHGRAIAVAIAGPPVNAHIRCDLIVQPERFIDVVVRGEAEGRAIAEASVVVIGGFGAPTVANQIADFPVGRRGRTNNDGRLRVEELFGAAFDVYAVAPGYTTAHRRLEGASLEFNEVVISLSRGAIAAGIVLREDGSPLPGEALRIETEETPPVEAFIDSMFMTWWTLDDGAWQLNRFRLTTTTGQDGRFRFESVPARKTARIVIGTPQFGIKPQTFGPFDLTPGDEHSDLVIRVEARMRVEVHVLDDSGQPLVAGVSVGSERFETFTSTPNGHGVFVLDFLPGPPPPIAVGAAGYRHQLVAPEQLAGGSVVVKLVRGKSLAGIVVDETGMPVPEVSVTAMPAQSASADAKRLSNWFTTGMIGWPATTLKDGTFSILGIDDLPLDLLVGGGDYGQYTMRDVAPGTQDLRLIVVRRPAR